MVALKVARLGVDGPLLTAPSLKLARLGFDGPLAVALNPIPAQTVEPETTVTITAVLTGGGAADSYSWRRVSGATVTLTLDDDVATFTAPSAMPPGTSVVIGVTATVSGTTSPEQQVTVTVLPQLRWTLNAARQWVGSPRTLLTT